MELPKLGTRAFTTFKVWLTATAWTLCYADGAGFGAATYRNICQTSNGAGYDFPSLQCPLVQQALLPPHVSVLAFTGNALALWFDGMYDSGLMFGLFVTTILIASASQMRRYVFDRIFSWPVIVLGCALAWSGGYFYEIHKTLTTGIAQVPLF